MKHLLLILLSAILLAACSTSKNTPSTTNRPQPRTGTQTPAPGTTTPAPTGNAQLDYVGLYKEAAVGEMQRTGIPASIKLAQGIIESASGRSELALIANNHFGIKCGNNWNGKIHNKKDDDRDPGGNLIESCFRKYNTPQESFFDHSEFLRDPRKSNRYGFLFNLDRRDYKSWARGLQSSGYATSPLYADQLIDLIERLRLYDHDQPGGTHIAPGSVVLASIPPQERIARVNNVKTVNSREGETLADIANLYRLRPEKVADFNDRAYPPGQYILPGTRIFIENKRNQWSGQTIHHFVREGQTMLDISQQYGVKLECLYTMNGMQFGAEPAANEKIRIRGKREQNETVRLRDDAHNDRSPATTATGPTTMKPDDDLLMDMTPSSTPPKPNTPPATIPDKPATTGVPFPTDPVPSTINAPPSVGTGATTGTVPTSQPTNIPAGYHQVVKGDTLFSLSRKYNITVARIKELNTLPGDNIQLGQVLRVR